MPDTDTALPDPPLVPQLQWSLLVATLWSAAMVHLKVLPFDQALLLLVLAVAGSLLGTQALPRLTHLSQLLFICASTGIILSTWPAPRTLSPALIFLGPACIAALMTVFGSRYTGWRRPVVAMSLAAVGTALIFALARLVRHGEMDFLRALRGVGAESISFLFPLALAVTAPRLAP